MSDRLRAHEKVDENDKPIKNTKDKTITSAMEI